MKRRSLLRAAGPDLIATDKQKKVAE